MLAVWYVDELAMSELTSMVKAEDGAFSEPSLGLAFSCGVSISSGDYSNLNEQHDDAAANLVVLSVSAVAGQDLGA